MRGLAAAVFGLLSACGATVDNVTPLQDATPGDDAGFDAPLPPDAPDDAPLGAFGAPTPVPGASTAVPEDDGTLSSDGLDLVFAFADPDDNDRKHLFLMTRLALDQPFSAPVALPFDTDGQTEQTPRFSADDRTLFFASNRDGSLDIFQATRSAPGANDFGTPVAVAGVSVDGATDKWFMPCDGGRYLMISDRDGDPDIYEGVLGQGDPVRVAELSSNDSETGTFLTDDCLTTYFASTRTGDNRIFTSTRTSVDQPWPEPVEVLDFNPAANEDQEDPWLSRDGRIFLLSSNVAGNKDVFESRR